MKPNPFCPLNHFTVPVAMMLSSSLLRTVLARCQPAMFGTHPTAITRTRRRRSCTRGPYSFVMLRVLAGGDDGGGADRLGSHGSWRGAEQGDGRGVRWPTRPRSVRTLCGANALTRCGRG